MVENLWFFQPCWLWLCGLRARSRQLLLSTICLGFMPGAERARRRCCVRLLQDSFQPLSRSVPLLRAVFPGADG
jgi:hypothetical protein